MKVKKGSNYPESYFTAEESKQTVVSMDFNFTSPEQIEEEKPVSQEVTNNDFSFVTNESTDYEADRQAEIQEAVKPMLEENTKKVLQEQHDKFKLEVHEVLADEVSHRLGKYEKRRRHRAIREGIGVALKWLFVAAIIFVFVANDQLREEVVTIAGDVKEIVVGLLNDEEVSSNKLVSDILDFGGME